MGSPSKTDILTGEARIPHKEISAKEWCALIEFALGKIRPCLKYVAGFKTIGEMLNSCSDELLLGRARFFTVKEDMPTFEESEGVNSKTRFVAVQRLETPDKSADSLIRRRILVMSDTGRFAILSLSYFVQGDSCAVCESSVAVIPEVRNLTSNKLVHPYSVLDKLYLIFCETVSEREKRLASMWMSRDMLKEMLRRIS